MFITKSFIKGDLYMKQYKERNFKNIRRLYDLLYKGDYSIDEQTFNDLNLEEVFTNIDRTYSTAGAEALYCMLRNPLMDKERLQTRSEMIDSFIKDEDLLVKIRYILYKMPLDKKNRLIDMIVSLTNVSMIKFVIYSILGKIIPIALIVIAIVLKDPRYIAALLLPFFLNIYINQKEESKINGDGLVQLRNLIETAKKLSKINDNKIESYKDKLNGILKSLSVIDRATLEMKLCHIFGGVFEIITIPFLIEETTYYRISGHIKNNVNEILQLFYLVGEIDALAAIASYKVSNKGKWTTPIFVDQTSLEIKNGVHPLVKEPVANSILLNGKGIVLTGTNMSGKSTFLKMLGTNILLAQTFNFALAGEYKASFMNIVTSISPKDDINNGKSYYLAEAEAILRIINSLDKDIPVFCLIDEIFRGTNPVERIASSAEILKYINDRDAITVVATHDREITEILKDKFGFYYFSEDVDSKNGLKFDYKLKKGVSKTKNAIKLLEYIGYPKEIIKSAYKRTESLEEYI